MPISAIAATTPGSGTIRCDRAGRGDFRVLPNETAQERLRHLAAPGIVFTDEEDERLQAVSPSR